MARDPKAEIEISAHSRTLGAKLREARAKFTTFGNELKRNVFGKELVGGSFLGKAGASMVGNIGARAFGAASGFLQEQAVNAYSYQDALKRLQIQSGKTAAEMSAVDAAITSSSNATGIAKSEVMDAARKYVSLTGDLDGATASVKSWARAAQASESSVADIASTAQALRDNLKIDPKDTEAAFAALITQGKEGAVELKDLAGLMSQITPLMAQFGGGTGLGGLRELGASVQVVRKGFGSAEETITGVQSLMTAIIKNAKNFQKAGVQVFDKDPKTGVKTLRSFKDIIAAIGESKLMKDPTKLEKAFGRVEAFRAFLQLKDNRDMLDSLISKSTDVGVVQRDLDAYLSSTAGKTKTAFEQAKNSIAEAFTPERIETFAKVAVQLAKALGEIVAVGGKMLGLAETAGKGFARMIFGETEDDRIAKLKAKRRVQRGVYLARHGVKTGDITDEMAKEDALMQNIDAGTWKPSGSTYVDVPTTMKDKTGQEFIYNKVVKVAANDVAELQKLKAESSQSSDAAMLGQVIDRAIETRVNKGLDVVADKLAAILAGQPVKVNVGADTIVKAHRKAPAHSGRPGV